MLQSAYSYFMLQLAFFAIVSLHIYTHDIAGAPLPPRLHRAPLPPRSMLYDPVILRGPAKQNCQTFNYF